MGKYILSRAARDDIHEILNYIADDNFEAAERVKEDLFDCFEMLAKWKASGRQRDELGEGLRSFAVRRYVVFYSSQESTTTIVRVIHMARDVGLLFDDQ